MACFKLRYFAMTTTLKTILVILAVAVITACSTKKPDPGRADKLVTPASQQVDLPPPYQTKAKMNFCKVIGWPAGKTPLAPAGFKVNLFADGLDNPRNILVGPNGDIFVSQANTELSALKKIGADIIGAGESQKYGKSANNIILLRDTNGDGIADSKSVFLSGLNQPYGMLIWGERFYVANTDGLWQFPYKAGQLKITAPGKMILSLPAGGYNNHWTRNLRANKAGTKIYISVGSGSNSAEHGLENEVRRAVILETDPDGSYERVYASGLRNPAGIDIEPTTGTLWASVNERDDLGDNLVPDYLTSVKDGGFYGWPFAYFGSHEDPDHKGESPELVKRSIVPDLALGPHTASLGLAFYTGDKFPQNYSGGAFIGQHGSWNSSKLVGYKVVFAPFKDGRATGVLEDFLTGFIADPKRMEVYGRPVGIAIMPDGSLLVADDTSNKIWHISAQ